MVISLSTRLSKKQKEKKAAKILERRQQNDDMADIIYVCADKAVDFIRRLPLNEATAIAYHTPVAQRQVLTRFRKFVAMKKDHDRRTGEWRTCSRECAATTRASC